MPFGSLELELLNVFTSNLQCNTNRLTLPVEGSTLIYIINDIGPVCVSIWMIHLDEDESFVCLGTKNAIHSDGSSG